MGHKQLCERLRTAGYTPILGTSGMFQHHSRLTKFCLYVDDFGIKYFTKSDLQHLLQTLGKSYTYSVDYSGADFCGLHYDWNYSREYVDVSLPLYVHNALRRL